LPTSTRNAREKLHLGEKRVGVDAAGFAVSGVRSTGGFVRSFESMDFGGVIDVGLQITRSTESLRKIFQVY
jgi:hypothetical protein